MPPTALLPSAAPGPSGGAACTKPRRILRAHPSDASTAVPDTSDDNLELEQAVCLDSDLEWEGVGHGDRSADGDSEGSPRATASAPPPACCSGLRTICDRLLVAVRSALSDKEHDPERLLKAVRKDGLALAGAAPSLRDSVEHVRAAVRSNGLALQYASARLAADRDIVLAAVRASGEALQFTALRDDRGVVEAALESGLALRWASARLQLDRALVLKAVRAHGPALGLLPAELRANAEIVEAATRRCADAWAYAAPHLQDRREPEEALERLEAQASRWRRLERDAFGAGTELELSVAERLEAEAACRALGLPCGRALALCEALRRRLRRRLSTEEVAAAALLVAKLQVARLGSRAGFREALSALSAGLPALELPLELTREEASAMQRRFARTEAEAVRLLGGNLALPSAEDWAELMLRRLCLELPLEASALLAAPRLAPSRTPRAAAAGGLLRALSAGLEDGARPARPIRGLTAALSRAAGCTEAQLRSWSQGPPPA